jgi:hypothetical protein
MQPSTDDLLIRQISALISATADAASTSSEHTPLPPSWRQGYTRPWLHIAPKSKGSRQHLPEAEPERRDGD